MLGVSGVSRQTSRSHGYRRRSVNIKDNFYTLPERRQAMIDPEPPMTGRPEIDAYLGAVAEHLARRWDLRIPAWMAHPGRFLKAPKFCSSIEELKPLLLAQSPSPSASG